MPAAITVAISEEQWRDLENQLGHIRGGAERAARNAINKAASKARTRVVKRLAGILNLKQDYIRGVVTLIPATPKKLVAVVRLTKKGIPLIDFPARQTRRGVVVRTRKGRPGELLRGTFLATMKSGHRGVFERRSRTKPGLKRREWRGKGAKRYKTELPIEERFGPTPMGIFEKAPGVAAEELAAAQADLAVQLASQIDFLLGRKKADRPTPAGE